MATAVAPTNAGGVIDPEKEQRHRELQREYLEFLDDGIDTRTYTEKVNMMMKEDQTRLIVDILHVYQKLPRRAHALMTTFVDEIVCFEAALRDFVVQLDVDYVKKHDHLSIGIEGS